MKSRRQILALSFLLAGILPCTANVSNCEVDPATGECTFDSGDDSSSEECTLYMAPSTIPKAGLGIFSGIERHVNEFIGHGDVMIPLTDVWFHLRALGDEYLERGDSENLFPAADFVWFGPELGMTREASYPVDGTTEYLVGFAPGIDAAINCHLALKNVEKMTPEFSFEGLHRSQDPGVGAFTPYHGCKTYVLRDIPAGGELFKDYGDNWFLGRTHTFGLLPLTEDFEIAERMMRRLHQLLEKRNVPEATRRDFWQLMNRLTWKKSRTMNAIPLAYENLELVAKEGIGAAYQPLAMRTLEDLEANGRCIDNIRPKPSTIRQAGRGAFATRFLPQNKIITGSPVMFIPSSDFFKMYDGDWFGKENIDTDNLVGHQILMNYCWHHNESSIYLCPYGSGLNFINHNKTMANVRLQWAKNGEMNHDASLLLLSPSLMINSAAPKLHMDVVATRDIEPGEELFLDYGDAWEKAWLEHVERWETEADYSPEYVSPREWNKQNPHAMLRTEDEQEKDPYPENFDLYCLEEITHPAANDYLTSEVAESLWEPSTQGYPCSVIERELQESREYWYRVRYVDEDVHDPGFSDRQVWMESDWIVREAMRFEDAPYSTDLFLDKAFRHPIGIPDDIFPEAWRGKFLPPLPNRRRSSVEIRQG